MRNATRRPVVITGIGLLSAAGEGAQTHRGALAAGKPLGLTSEGFAPYTVHALAEPDWSAQIGRRDMRQMEPWQRIGTYAAGLALDDAKAKDEALLDRMDMIVAAGGGERDIEVDNAVIEAVRSGGEPGAVLNERLPNDL
ncbi:MAG: beta-ketoacyl-ACP synthase, partial [Pseudomonadota bacterium]